ncbi:MAG: ATP/GTP-binding protein [Geminicoccaceae bacterium]|nr:ATP/GTP-binding protein [Geminicoccaceae bacterium]
MLDAILKTGKPAIARALAMLESAPFSSAALDLLDEAWASPRAHVIGVTGPPGVGKSTLLSAVVGELRGRGRTVAVLAVDPSSRRTKGALLGDRTRIDADPEDQGVFVRSLAARERLGGLADDAVAAVVLMRALYDVVLVETVGVGQSETDVADLADTVVLAVQPASGDSLQFLKAGIAEIPDLAVVTKADLGPPAERAARDLKQALRAQPSHGADSPPPDILLVAAFEGRGVPDLCDRLGSRLTRIAPGLPARRAAQARLWLEAWVRAEWGRQGLARARPELERQDPAASPFRRLQTVVAGLAGGD